MKPVWFQKNKGVELKTSWFIGTAEMKVLVNTSAVQSVFRWWDSELNTLVCSSYQPRVCVCVSVSTQSYCAAVCYFCSSWSALWQTHAHAHAHAHTHTHTHTHAHRHGWNPPYWSDTSEKQLFKIEFPSLKRPSRSLHLLIEQINVWWIYLKLCYFLKNVH